MGGIVYGGRGELEGWRVSGVLGPGGVAFLGRSVLGLWVLGVFGIRVVGLSMDSCFWGE